MEAHVVDFPAVDFRLRLGDFSENFKGKFFGAVGNFRVFDNRLYVAEAAVFVRMCVFVDGTFRVGVFVMMFAVRVFVCVRVGRVVRMFVPVQNYLRFRAENSAAPVFRKLDFPAADSELFKLANERVLIRAQIDHRAEVHIAADSRKAVVINCLHR